MGAWDLHLLQPQSLNWARVALVVLHPGKVYSVHSEKKRSLRRRADGYAPVVLAVVPHPGRGVPVVEDDGGTVAEIHRTSILANQVSVVAVKK